MPRSLFLTVACLILPLAANILPPTAQAVELSQLLQPKLVHLRNEAIPEWSSFPAEAEAARLTIPFRASKNEREFALRIRQQDVKQSWRVLLNDRSLGDLIRDEADIIFYLPIPPGSLHGGENTLTIETKPSGKPASPGKSPPVSDDIRIGELSILNAPVSEVLSTATLEVRVQDEDARAPLPCRITIATPAGTLQATSAVSSDRIAARPGVIYTADGHAKFSLPAGKYVVYAGRGFEYSLARAEITAVAGETAQVPLSICREVPTPDQIACDTHIHTVTHSGHGDCTLAERLITLAGEGIELPIATDHNRHVDYRPLAEKLGLSQYFTPVIGNEVTTQVGHFNIFPVAAGARIANHQHKDWRQVFEEIRGTPGVEIAVLNHARDIHNGLRPFGAEWFNPVAGTFANPALNQFDAMEVINSGAVLRDPLRLPRDWMAVLNAGHQKTPIGSSDSHDVSRYIVGQGRTYVRSKSSDAGNIDVAAAMQSLRHGQVAVSYALLVDLQLHDDDKWKIPFKPTTTEWRAKLRVLGPHWARASKVQLYGNGQLLREESIETSADKTNERGVLWQAEWKLPLPKHDTILVAVALGPGITEPYWATAKPYQPTSLDFEPYTLAVTGPILFNCDAQPKFCTPRDLGTQIVERARGDLSEMIRLLAGYDAAVAAQAMDIYLTTKPPPEAATIESALKTAPANIAAPLREAWQAWRDQQLLRAKE